MKKQKLDKYGWPEREYTPEMPAYSTEYYKIFKKTYWGSFTKPCLSKDDEITIKNRNWFAKKFKLEKYIEKDRERFHSKEYLCDHPELYLKEDGSLIYLISPYNEGIKVDTVASELGFSKLEKPIYYHNATTYYKEFPTMKEYRKFFKDLDKEYYKNQKLGGT